MTVTSISSREDEASQEAVVPPLVTVITPTWQRHDRLTDLCIPSVEAQDYPRVEHIVVSDGPDEVLGRRLGQPWVHTGNSKWHARWFFQLPEHDPSIHWGSFARLGALEYAAGELITYCDDDDALRPGHCSRLAAALAENPDAGWAYSQMASHHVDESVTVIGEGPPAMGSIGTPMIMHRKEILEHGTWGPPSPFEDWELVHRWMDAGVKWTAVDEVTSDVWPSAYHGH